MSEIRLVTLKLFAFELLKIAILNLVSMIETQFLSQTGPELHKIFLGTRSRMSKIRLVTGELLALKD